MGGMFVITIRSVEGMHGDRTIRSVKGCMVGGPFNHYYGRNVSHYH